MNEILIEHTKFNYEDIKEVESVFINNYPIVYILYNQSKNKSRPKAYIGQTVQALRRMKQHLENQNRKQLTDTLFIGHEHFNQSATYNIETNLINFFIADEQFSLQNISQTSQTQIHNYYQKEYYNEELFESLWEALRANGLAKHSTDVLRNKDIYKLSPFKELSQEQLELKQSILDYCRKHINTKDHQVFVIHGEAGTGKSVVLSSLFNTIQELTKDKSSKLHKTDNYLLVNHGEMIKTYQSIANSLPHLAKNRFEKPTTFVNKYTDKEADIVLVDEAHLLLSSKDAFNNFKYENHLEEIIKRSKITIIIFDDKQVLRMKNHWDRDRLSEMLTNYSTTEYNLTNQFRMLASPDIIHWIDSFVQKQVTHLPANTENFDLRIMKTADELKAYIQDANSMMGLSRIVSTFDYLHKKDGKTYYVDEEGLNMPWNTTDSHITWAERPETINEVGSIYTVQGFDLNYVGVVLGPSIDFDEERKELVIDVEKYKDTGAFSGSNRFDQLSERNRHKEHIILNSINVLMKRGVHGLAIYAVNESLREKLLTLQTEREEAYE